MLALFERVVLTVEYYPATAKVPEGYELEVFTASGKTLAVVSAPATFVRRATERDILTVREAAGR
jgi:hypothetical protein